MSKMSSVFIIRKLIFVKSWSWSTKNTSETAEKFPLTKRFYVRIDCICRISRRSFPSFLFSFSPDSSGSKHCWSWSKIHQIESELELLQGFEFISGLRIVSHFFSSNISRKLVNLFIREQNCLEDLCNLTFLINCKFYSEVADSKI